MPGATLAWNPEFLREGHAVTDTLRAPTGSSTGSRTTAGAAAAAQALLDEVYAHAVAAGTPLIVTDYATAELVKMAANAFLATKISLHQRDGRAVRGAGADVTQLATAIGHDDRIGPKFLGAGVGFGGRLPAQGHPGIHGPRRRSSAPIRP